MQGSFGKRGGREEGGGRRGRALMGGGLGRAEGAKRDKGRIIC